MIPVRLDIEGLYSYKEKQSIDFTQLTSAGLFGIFGAVGSGKSSILEAILLALYSQTERLSPKGERASMVNLQSEKISIEFEFLAGKNNAIRYKAQYLAKRNRNNWEDVKTATHTFYRATNDSWEPLEERGEDILGMKLDHFRQTVIIPQGKFRDFIELGPKDRATMMKDLFGLSRFELSPQTKALLSEVYAQKLKLKTQLETLSDYTKEKLQEQSTLLKNLKEKEKGSASELEKLEAQFSHAKQLKDKHQEYKEIQKKWNELQTRSTAIERSKANLQQYQKATLHFKPLFTQLEELRIDLEKYKVSVTDCQRWKDDFEKEVSALLETETSLQKEYQKKGEREAKIRDLKKVMEINALEIDSKTNQALIEKLSPTIQDCQDKITQLTKQIEEQEGLYDNLQAPDPNELANLKNMVWEMEELIKQITQLEKELQQNKLQQAEVNEQAIAIRKAMPEGITTLEDWIQTVENQIRHLEVLREKLLQQQSLTAYAGHLHDGQPCPLCGSESHPMPLPADFDNLELSTNESQIKEAKTFLKQVRQKGSSMDRILFSLQDLGEKISEKEKQLAGLSERKKQLHHQLAEKGYSTVHEVQEALLEANKTTEKQSKLLSSLKALRQDCSKLREDSSSNQEKLQKAQNEYSSQLSAINSKKDDLQFKDFCQPYFAQTNEQIKTTIDKVQQAIDQLEVKITRNKDALIDSRGRQSTNLANLKQFSELLKGCEEKQVAQKETLKNKMQEMGFGLEEELKAILDQQLDTEKLEAQINEFERQWHLTKDRLEAYVQNKEVTGFEEEWFARLSSELSQSKETFDQLKKEIALTQNQMETTQQKLEEKAGLNKSLDVVEKRESNLRELEGLFKGSGFVKYVSSIYLKELSHTANRRFMKLTKNNLSLEIDNDNTFWVLDHLNGGKRRLLKTLSGGQTFQASLCLALSLAEKVKSLNWADQSFFFLDEGFGSLDKNSLRVVFETLKSLRHENRIVGIISHVEELQQEIGVYAEVELDGEKGSVVRYSY
ncbi:SMC family ATPase [Litoribacter ruber]|uniref:SbcC/MukB-like Walker B domain-containing protein n=1 Tax=Litoribacter ruber TaxID=702568 RepID=UPI001BD91DD2|nr:SMC family ATPase [Litoribacter ruber]MBT0809901.1 SMC family ATPase [Litoribacter ruber]